QRRRVASEAGAIEAVRRAAREPASRGSSRSSGGQPRSKARATASAAPDPSGSVTGQPGDRSVLASGRGTETILAPERESVANRTQSVSPPVSGGGSETSSSERRQRAIRP